MRRKLQKSDQNKLCSNAIRSIGVSIDGFKGMGIRVHINVSFDPCIFCSFDASSCGKVQQTWLKISYLVVFYWGFLHDVTKIQTTKLLILLRFYFHDN